MQTPSPHGNSGRRIGHYTILQQIGSGGMGEVFSAVRSDGQFDQKVAIKLVRESADSAGVLDRFRNERQILAGLNHVNIARLLDGGTAEDGTPFFAMELVSGQPIDVYCDAHKLSISKRLELFRQVCSAVQYAHQHLVIHRDIKPGNILVTEDGTPKLLDFGIARILNAAGSLDATQFRSFTPDYASPEQLRGDPISTASDLYSLGVVLYQLLTGRFPYRVEPRTPAKLANAIATGEPERPSTCVVQKGTVTAAEGLREVTPEFFANARETTPSLLQHELRGDLDYILLKALRKEPELRYSSAEQFFEDIKNHLDARPVSARKGTWTYYTGKFLRRHKAGVAAAALVVVALLSGLGVTLREARIAEANRRKADARFNDVHKLANSLIFDVHDSIANLPGAGDSRKLILQKAIEYLDTLATDTQNDPGMMRDLVVGYSRIAELEGNPAHPNLGNTKAALANYQKSLTFAEPLVRLNPKNDTDQLNLAEIYVDLAETNSAAVGNVSEALRYLQLSLPIFDRELQMHPKDNRVLGQATRAYFNLGVLQIGGGLVGTTGTVTSGIDALEKALDLDRRAIEVGPTNVGFRSEQANIDGVLGDAYLKLGNRTAAEARFREGLAAITVLDPKGENIRVMVNKSVSVTKLGDALMLGGRYSEALIYYQQGLEIAEKISARDKSPISFAQIKITRGQVGLALRTLGRFDESNRQFKTLQSEGANLSAQIATFRVLDGVTGLWFGQSLLVQKKTADAAREFSRSKVLIASLGDIKALDPRMKTYFSAAQFGLGRALALQGKFSDAQKEIESSISILEELAAKAPLQQEQLYTLAESYNQAGLLFVGQSQKARGNVGLQDWKTARSWFEKSAETWRKVSNPARFSTYGLEVSVPDDISQRITECDAQIKKLEGSSD